MSDPTTTTVSEIKPLFKELRSDAGQLVGYAILIDREQVGKVTQVVSKDKKGRRVVTWTAQVGRVRKSAPTRCDAVMAAIPGSVVAR